jgi:trimeric autotransporter adhesin
MRFPSLASAVTCLTIGALTVSSCTQPVDLVPVASITLAPPNDSVEIAETYNRWIVALKDAQGNTLTGRTVSWTSSFPAIATVDATSGLVTAVASGTTVITASANGKTASSTIKVLVPVLSIIATSDSFDLPMTTTRTIGVTVVGPAGVALTNRAITWSSSNTAVAVVNSSGLVTAVGAGTVSIRIQAGPLEKIVRVRVIGEPATNVRITPTQTVHIVRLGQTYQLNAQCLNILGQPLNRFIAWNSSNPLVATVNGSGLVSGNAVGSASISAQCDAVSASVTAQVTPIPVGSVTITPSAMTLIDNEQGQLSVTARDTANNVISLLGRNVQWTSDNIPVATVTGQGVVAAVSPGTARVQVSVDGVFSTAITITVNPVPVATVSISPTGVNLLVNGQAQLTATPRDVANNILSLQGRTVVWSSNNQGVAQVSSTGVVTGISAGTAQVMVTVDGVASIAVTINVF